MNSIKTEVRNALNEYLSLGFDTLPLAAGTKDRPISRGWQNLEPHRMWRYASSDSNIAIRCGGDIHLAVIDCDEKNQKGTVKKFVDYFSGLGLSPGDYPMIQTASGIGRHLYFKMDEEITGNYKTLSNHFGAGEFRYGSGAYVVAPPSKINNSGSYQILDGSFYSLPTLAQKDFLPLLKDQSFQVENRNQNKHIPRRTMNLLNGKSLYQYSSRSEGEQAIILGLINGRFDFKHTLNLFKKYPAFGKFSEINERNPERAEKWLKHSYDKAFNYSENHSSPGRQEAEKIMYWANNRPWKGRTGSYDKQVFLAHAGIAWKAGRISNYAASCRCLAEVAGISHVAASNATNRLCDMELITRIAPAIADCAALYQINIEKINGARQTFTLPSPPSVRKCKDLSNHDAFRWAGLGKSAGEVYSALSKKPMTIEELALSTGRHERTVKRALRKITRIVDGVTGELIEMVGCDGEKWYAKEVNLDYLAKMIGTFGAKQRQIKKHKHERKLHRRSLIMENLTSQGS